MQSDKPDTPRPEPFDDDPQPVTESTGDALHVPTPPDEPAFQEQLHARLLHALVRAVHAFASSSSRSALQASFAALLDAVHAQRAFLARVDASGRISEVLTVKGLRDDDIDALVAGRSVAGLDDGLLRHVMNLGQARIVEDGRTLAKESSRASRRGAYSVACLPIQDPHTGTPLAVLYLQTSSLAAPLTPAMLPALEAYAIALAHAWQGWDTAATDTKRTRRVPTQVEIVGQSASTRALRARIDRVVLPAMAAPRPDSILILGPTGSGKELLARHLHARSARAAAPFVAANCASFSGDVLESTLFGHVRGAFTGAVGPADGLFVAAHRGVLFLDELGDMPPQGQRALLRVLETRCVRPVGGRDERAVDVQLICATNRDLVAELRAGRFREDLYYRVRGLTLRLAPLSERTDDIAPLLSHYLGLHQRRLGRQGVRLAPDAMQRLTSYPWPGNVRELSHACSLLVLHARAEAPIDAALVDEVLPDVQATPGDQELPEDWAWDEAPAAVVSAARVAASNAAIAASVTPATVPSPPSEPPADLVHDAVHRSLKGEGTFQEAASAFEREYLLRLGQALRWNKTSMANALGVDRKTLYSRLHRYELMALAAEGARGSDHDD